MATYRIKDWFVKASGTANKRGTRFKNGDRPNEATFTDLLKSVVFKSSPDDRAKEESAGKSMADISGHVILATDEQAKSGYKHDEKSIVARPSQLPTVAAGSIPTPSGDAPLTVTVEGTTKNTFLVRLSDTFSLWLTSVKSVADGVRKDFDDSRKTGGDFKLLSEQVTTNTGKLVGLTPAGGLSFVPVGAVMQWLNTSIPDGFFPLDGNQSISKEDYPILHDIIGDGYQPGTGAPVGFFGLPNMNGRVAIGGNDVGNESGEESVELSANQIPKHTHPNTFSIVSDSGQHEHGISVGRSVSSGGTKYTNTAALGNTAYDSIETDGKLGKGDGAHNHGISGSIGNNESSETAISLMQPSLEVIFIIKADPQD